MLFLCLLGVAGDDESSPTPTTSTVSSSVVPPPGPTMAGHTPGGLPPITDSAFSLVVLIYVSVAFLCVFFLFCWKTNTDEQGDKTMSCPLMGETKAVMVNQPLEPRVIPPTPPRSIRSSVSTPSNLDETTAV